MKLTELLTESRADKSSVTDMFKKFLPIAMEVLELDRLPKFKFSAIIDTGHQPSFGMYSIDDKMLHVALKNRHPVDILRTVAHELVRNDKLDLALQYLARSIAGCIEDKNFSTYEGNRNCGKGAIGHLLGAFGDYIKPLLLSNVTCSRETSHESAKDLYWLMDYEFARLAISQEVPVEGLKLRSDMIKRICSGGDTHTARRNYDRRDTNFQVECSVMMMGNEKIIVEGDLNEHYIEFNSAVQFKSQEFIDALELEDDAKKKYRLADPDIKAKCDSPLWYLAMVNCLFDAFIDKPIVMEYVTEEASVIQQILAKYVVTKDKNDIVLASDFDEFGTKAKPELKMLGLEYKKSKSKSLRDKLCFFGIKLKS